MTLKNSFIYLFSTLLFSTQVYSNDSEVVSNDSEVVNEKFSFVNQIYSDSWALIIGINDYINVEPLTYAVDDAISVIKMFVEKYGEQALGGVTWHDVLTMMCNN